MKDFLTRTAKLNRAIVSDDFEKTLNVIQKRIPLTVHSYKTGTQCFDWVIPKKWVIRDAYIETSSGKRVLDWRKNPLHVVIGSLPIARQKISRKDLLKRLHTSEKYENEIPYHFKYYELDWGFCMSKKDLKKLVDDEYYIAIDSEYVDGYLMVGEHVIEGETDESIVLLSHVDHPAQVNDGLAGAATLLALAEKLKGMRPHYTIRMHFLSETIGSIAYLHHNRELIPRIRGAVFCEMPGTPKYPMVLQYSKEGNSMLDRIARRVLKASGEQVEYAECFQHVVNDDGFYNAPGIDVPCISLSRSKKLTPEDWYHFPYYHTSGDSLKHFDFDAAERFLAHLEGIVRVANTEKKVWKKYRGVPNLSRHGLWIDWRVFPKASQVIDEILFHLDDGIAVDDLANETGVPRDEIQAFLGKLEEKGLIELAV